VRTLKHPRANGFRQLRRLALLLVGFYVLVGNPFGGQESLEASPSPVPALADGFSAGQAEGESAAQEAEHAADELAPNDHGIDVAQMFLILIAILLVGKFLGEMAERLGQPAVLGELIAGVILGGSVLGIIPAEGTAMREVIHVFAEIGVSILLFEIGLETDLKEMFRVGPSASAVAMVGVLMPFGLGFAYWYLFDPSIGGTPFGVTSVMVAIFVGATLTATSVGITARVLSDLDKMHTSEARIIIGAAVIDDVLGIVILAVVVGMAGGAAVTVLGISAFCFALLLAALAALSGSAMIIGAFAAGIVLSSTNQFDTVVEKIEPVADVFTPIFFVVVGAPVNVRLFIPGSADFNLSVLAVGTILTVIAIIGKIVSGLAVRQPGINRLAVGVGMVPRGEVGLIFASFGLGAGILTGEVYSAILIMVIVSTFLVPPLLKPLLERNPPVEGDRAPIHQPPDEV
jgi:Kef-type K+ transport system membrane component KefB